MLLIFDGTDKVGKTTLINAIDKATKYQHIMIDRGPVSYLVYDKLLNRKLIHPQFEYLRDLCDLDTINHLVIYLHADAEMIEQRLKENNEVLPNDLTPDDFLSEFYNQHARLKRITRHHIDINTTTNTIEENVQIILDCINSINDTNELIKLTEKYYSDDYVEYYPSYNVFSLDMFKNIPFDICVDKPYYEMLGSSLNHLLYKYSINLINSRQLVYNSPDCITNVQICCDTEGNPESIHITQRSLNIEHHGYNDLYFFVDWIRYNNLPIKKIYYNVIVPHKYNKYNFLKKGGKENASTQ